MRSKDVKLTYMEVVDGGVTSGPYFLWEIALKVVIYGRNIPLNALGKA